MAIVVAMDRETWTNRATRLTGDVACGASFTFTASVSDLRASRPGFARVSRPSHPHSQTIVVTVVATVGAVAVAGVGVASGHWDAQLDRAASRRRRCRWRSAFSGAAFGAVASSGLDDGLRNTRDSFARPPDLPLDRPVVLDSQVERRWRRFPRHRHVMMI